MNEALLDIIDKSKIEKKTRPIRKINSNLFFILSNRYKTKGIFNAIEKAVMFLFAVTPFNLPGSINPFNSIIPIA